MINDRNKAYNDKIAASFFHNLITYLVHNPRSISYSNTEICVCVYIYWSQKETLSFVVLKYSSSKNEIS